MSKSTFLSKLKFPHIFVYEASAGSGKTRRLSQRYVDFLLSEVKTPQDPSSCRPQDQKKPPEAAFFDFRSLLALTFTNEAADQMRQEILKILKTKALAQDKESLRARQITDDIIRNYSDFSVRTIDSFIHSILIASSLELKLPPDYEIVSSPRPYLEYVLDDLLDQIVRDPQVREMFGAFLEHFLIVEGKKHWTPKTTLLNLLSRFYREENSRAKLFEDISAGLDLSQEELQLKAELGSFLALLQDREKINQRFIKGLSALLNESGPAFIKDLSRYLNRTLEPQGGILNKDAPLAEASLRQKWEGLKKRLGDYAYAFVWTRYSFYLKVYTRFRARLENFKEEKRIVFLEELNKKAKDFLTSEGFLPTEIYYKLAQVLAHYLIDEFQDTNILQWQNLQVLVEDALSKGGSLFYVGDKKQAIYRFRGGEAELFDSVKTRLAKQAAKIYENCLLCNYRSQRAIIDFNNFTFSRENLDKFLSGFTQLTNEHRRRILNVFKDSRQVPAEENKQGGYVRLKILQADNSDQAKESAYGALKEDILELRQRYNWRDILILVRDNQEAEELAGFLLKEQLPVCAGRTVSIRQNYIIRQIIALLRFLNSPIDNLSFANFILGEVFAKASGIEEAELRLWLENRQDSEPARVLYTQFRAAYPHAWEEFLQYLFNAVGFLPVYDMVKTILIKFEVERNFPQNSGFLQRLLELLNDLKEEGRNSLADFLDWFDRAEEEELFVMLAPGLNAIKILTIHKAKGLSAPVVILPNATLEIKVGESSSEAPKIVYESTQALNLLYLQKEVYHSHPKLALVYQQEYFQALLDELNCLYVGFTRAARELHIYLAQKINRSHNHLIPLLFGQDENAKFREFGQKPLAALKPKPPIKGVPEATQPAQILPQELFQSILKEQLLCAEGVPSIERRQSGRRGELLHYLLSEIEPFSFLKNKEAYAQGIYDACRTFNYPDSRQIMQGLFDFFSDPGIQRFYNPAFAAFNEKEIVDSQGRLKRIDRLVFAEDKVMVIDYKTAEEYQSEHADQVREYIRLVSRIYPGKLYEGWLVYFDTKNVIKLGDVP